jgi:hypothetical protein
MEDLERIRECLKKHDEVELAYLFGSSASGRTGKLSDVDVGIYLSEDLNRLELMGELTSLLKTDEIDLVIMNRASVSLNYEIIKCNRPIYVKNRGKKVEVEHEILSKYLDRRYHDKLYYEIFRRRVIEGGLTYR